MASAAVETRRTMVQASIAINPETITIARTTKVRSGGGFTETPITPAPFTGRLFLGSMNQGRWDAENRGAEVVSDRWWLLAPYNADVKADEDTTDVFDIGGTRYQIKEVLPVKLEGEIVSQQCALQAV